MNVLFVYSLYNIASSKKPIRTPEAMQFGISYISSFLKKHGHNTKLIVLSRISGWKNKKIIEDYIKKFQPKLIGFTAVSSEYDFIFSLAEYIKSVFPDIYLIIGGTHVSLNPGDALKVFDALCIGEGEMATLELVSELEKGKTPSNIANLWIKNETSIEKNATRPFLQNLDMLPFPDREMWEDWISKDPKAIYSVLLGRGCIFECTYCCNHSLKKIAPGTYTRFRSPDNIIEEIKEIINKCPNEKEIYLEVENICLNIAWTLELCSKLEDLNRTLTKPLSFGANIRITPNLDLKRIFAALKKSSFRFINIGLESGSERVRHDILRRYYSNEDIINAVKLAREYGLQVSFLNLIGIPGETPSDFKKTIEVNRICMPDWMGMSIFYPYPGTDLYSTCKNRGLLKKSLPTEMERKIAVLDPPEFRKNQIQHYYIWFEYLVYRGYKPIYKLLLKIIFLKMVTNSYVSPVYNIYRKFKYFFLN